MAWDTLGTQNIFYPGHAQRTWAQLIGLGQIRGRERASATPNAASRVSRLLMRVSATAALRGRYILEWNVAQTHYMSDGNFACVNAPVHLRFRYQLPVPVHP